MKRSRSLMPQRLLSFPLAGVIILSFVLAPVQGEDWPCWRGPRGDGSWKAPPLADKLPAPEKTVVWRQSIGPGYAGISVVEDRVYTLDRVPHPGAEPDGQERVLCLDAATGREVWSHTYDAHYGSLDYGHGPRSSPVIEGGVVYVLGAVGQAVALDAKRGAVLWQRDLRKEESAVIPTWGLAASPLVLGNIVLLHAGLPKGSLVALDKATGKEVWRAIDDAAGYATPLLIHRPFGSQLIAWTPNQVQGIHPTSGEVEWMIPYRVTYGVSIATPIEHEGIVFVSGYWEGSKAIQLGPLRTDARLIYEENRWLRGLMAPPLQRGHEAFLLDKKHGLTSFDLRTGQKNWDDANAMTPTGTNPQATFVWTGQNRDVLAWNSEGDVVLASLETEGYREKDRVHLLDPAPPSHTLWSNPAFAGDSVYVRSDQTILRYRLTTNLPVGTAQER